MIGAFTAQIVMFCIASMFTVLSFERLQGQSIPDLINRNYCVDVLYRRNREMYCYSRSGQPCHSTHQVRHPHQVLAHVVLEGEGAARLSHARGERRPRK